jgi:hypothetical protein
MFRLGTNRPYTKCCLFELSRRGVAANCWRYAKRTGCRCAGSDGLDANAALEAIARQGRCAQVRLSIVETLPRLGSVHVIYLHDEFQSFVERPGKREASGSNAAVNAASGQRGRPAFQEGHADAPQDLSRGKGSVELPKKVEKILWNILAQHVVIDRRRARRRFRRGSGGSSCLRP